MGLHFTKQTLKVGLCIFLVASSALPRCFASSLHSVKYDLQFKASFSRWMPGHDYKWLKAQCWQESRFKANAVSPAGAQGLCQFMPGTAKDVATVIGTLAPFSAYWSINAAGYYDSKMYRFWKSPRPILDRLYLMLASYNAGAGNLARAQRVCDMSVLYASIIECLPKITGHHSKETIDYVVRIKSFKRQLDNKTNFRRRTALLYLHDNKSR